MKDKPVDKIKTEISEEKKEPQEFSPRQIWAKMIEKRREVNTNGRKKE